MKHVLDYVLKEFKSSTRRSKSREIEDEQFLLHLEQTDSIPLPVACAFLLTDVAMIDGNFDDSEYKFLFEKLDKNFGLTGKDAEQVVDQVRTMLATARGALSYAEYLKQNFSLDERKKIYACIEGMIQADSVEDGFETYLKTRFATALGITE